MTRSQPGKKWQIVLCIAYALLHQPVAGAPNDADRAAVMAAVATIRNVVREPDRFASLLNRHLRLSSCYPLTSGPQACSYWAAELDEDWPIALTSLYIHSMRRFGDSGGTALWQVRQDLCMGAEEIELPAGVRRELEVPLMDFFAGSEIDIAVRRRFALTIPHPGWSKVELTVQTRDNCVSTLSLELARSRN